MDECNKRQTSGGVPKKKRGLFIFEKDKTNRRTVDNFPKRMLPWHIPHPLSMVHLLDMYSIFISCQDLLIRFAMISLGEGEK